MTTLAYHNFLDNQYHNRSLMQSGSEGIFNVSPLKRCHSATDYGMQSTSCYNGAVKKPCHSEGDLDAEELITLSYDLINQIQRREQYQSITESSSVTEISREDSNGSTVLSVSADSSSYGYHGYDGRQDVLADIADGNASLSPQSSIDSPVFSEYSPCDSAATKVAKMAISNGKPLYTTELQVLCRICGDRASGYHYGVHSCEGCKGFFRRTLKKELVYKPCRDSAQCRIETGTRNKCQYCRYRKCINAGMSQNAVRFGRMPKVEREKLIADKEELNNTCTSRIMELRALSDRIKGAFQECFEHCKFMTNYLQNNTKETNHIKVEPDLSFTTDSMTAQIFAQQNIFKCFQDAILPIIEGTVKFTKKIPNLSDLPMVNRIALLKQNCFCVPVILTYLMFQSSTLYLEGKTSSISVTHLPTTQYSCWEVQCLFDGLFRVAQKMATVQLQVVEVALFCAIVLLTESPGISDFALVEGLQTDLLDSLRLELKHNHPKDKYLFPRLLVLIPQLVQITEEFRSNLRGQLFDSTSNFSQTHELVCELFDLR